jgi:CRISPR-associated protein Csx17
MKRITLTGCAPDVLIHYLKSLGVLRLVGEQFDERVRGTWQGSAFVIETESTKDELVDFFLHKYRPTPIVAPWNGGSSFYPKDRSQRETVDALCAIEAERLDVYRDTIRQAREIVGALPESPKDKDEKAALLRACRRELPDEALEWLDAAFVLSDERTGYPPLLGTGGNDGRLEFTINFMARLLLVLPEAARGNNPDRRRAVSERNLRFALFAEGTPVLESAAVGQFHPGGAGGVNLTQGVTAGALVNPWDFVLAIEGALLLASATTRQLAAGARSGASFPFTAQSSTVGYATATLGESVRAEMWLPLWSRMSSVKEIAHVFGEGRARFGGRSQSRQERGQDEDKPGKSKAVEPRRDARSGFDFARAVAELGVDRGIDAFARYGFIERNGLAYLATPLGRFEVPRDKETNTYAALLVEADGWLEHLRRATRGTDKTPPRFIRARLNIEEAIFDLCASKDDRQRKERLRTVLVALGAAEMELARSPKFRDEHAIPPLASLTVAWADACEYEDEEVGATEYRIACALASIVDRDGLAPLRVNVEPVEFSPKERKFKWVTSDVRVAWSAGALVQNLALVLRRRWIDARREDLWSEAQRGADKSIDGDNVSKLTHARRAIGARRFVRLNDVAKFINADVDEKQVENFLRALTLINWRGAKSRLLAAPNNSQDSRPDVQRSPARLYPVYALLKLLFLSNEVFKRESEDARPTDKGRKPREDFFKPYSSTFAGEIGHEPSLVPLLMTNHRSQIHRALKRAAQRLRISGLTPFADDFYLDERHGARFAAALLIPLSYVETGALCQAVLRPLEKDPTTKDDGEE